jgi:hypothetical protein
VLLHRMTAATRRTRAVRRPIQSRSQTASARTPRMRFRFVGLLLWREMILPREGSFLIFVSLDDVLNVNWWTAFSRRGCDPVAWKLVEQFL